jgi:hypothetical protein
MLRAKIRFASMTAVVLVALGGEASSGEIPEQSGA